MRSYEVSSRDTVVNCDVSGAPLFAAIRQPAFLYGSDGTILAANDLAEALAGRVLVGCSAEDVVRLCHVRRPDGTPFPPRRLPASRALAGEEVIEHPVAVTAADGRDLHFLVTASSIRENHCITGALCVWQDVTRLVRTEESLRTSLERLAFGQRAARTGFWDWVTPPHGSLNWSPEFYELFGLDNSLDPSLALWLDAIHPDDREAALAWVIASIEERTSIASEYRIVLPDGSERWIGAYGDTVYDADGRPQRTAGICVDIDECKRAEEELRKREQQLKLALEGASAGMWVRNPDGRWIATPQMNALFGLPPDAPPLREEEFSAFIHPDDLAAIGDAWSAAGEGSSSYDQEYRVVWPDGSVHWLASKGRTVADSGAACRFIGITYDITERKRAEEALRETAERYQQALDSPLVGFAHCEIVVDRDGAPTDFVYLDVNATFEAFTGLSRETVLHRRVTEVLDPAEVADAIRIYGRVAQSGEPATFDYPIPSIGKWFEAAAFSPRRGQFIVFFTDISRRKRAKGALRKSEARQALLAEVAGRLLATEEPQAVIDDLCRRALAVLDCDVFFNYLLDEASDRLMLNACGGISAEEAGRVRQLDLGTAVCGCAARDGCRIVAEAIPDNPDPRTDLVAGYGIRAYACHPLMVGGRPIGTLSFGTRARDRFTVDELATMRAIADLIAVAMQRIADLDALRASEERLRFAQEGAGVGIWDHDLASDRVTLSPKLLERYGMMEKAVVHYGDWARLLHPDDRERVEAEWRAAIAAGQPLDLDFRVVLPSGDERWIQFRGRGSANGPDGPGRVLGVVIDVTDRRRAETALARYAANLRASNEELQRFAYVASHNLQEPLRSIVSFSQLLERRYRGQLDADAEDYIRFIVDGGNRMQALIRDLLLFSRIETKARKPVPTDAGAAVRSALRTLEGSVCEGGNTVVVGPLPTVMADPAQLEQVFTNLIGNAIKYRRPDAPIEIGISARSADGMWEFAIRDNGIGIEREYFDRIFEMFRRLHTHDKYDGTGIGLAIVRKIVERHGGAVRVESTPGAGSTFFFTLPAA